MTSPLCESCGKPANVATGLCLVCEARIFNYWNYNEKEC
nr:MAG TPA: zinc-ribbon domain protein [Caudoviricetes sp.]